MWPTQAGKSFCRANGQSVMRSQHLYLLHARSPSLQQPGTTGRKTWKASAHRTFAARHDNTSSAFVSSQKSQCEPVLQAMLTDHVLRDSPAKKSHNTKSASQGKAAQLVYKMVGKIMAGGACKTDEFLSNRNIIESSLPHIKSVYVLQTLARCCVASNPPHPDLLSTLPKVLNRLASLPGLDQKSRQKALSWILHWCGQGLCITLESEAVIRKHLFVKEFENNAFLVSYAFAMTVLNVPDTGRANELVNHPLVIGDKSNWHHQQAVLNVVQYAVLSGVDCSHLVDSLSNIDRLLQGMLFGMLNNNK